MTDDDTPRPAESDASLELTRRRFLQGSGAAAVGVLGLLQDSQAVASKASPLGQPSGWVKGNRPNFLILMCDEMRFPPIYESQATKAFRQQYLQTQNSLRQNGIDFQRHYAASVACSPSRASMYTGHYPSLHGVTHTTGAAKESVDPDVFWLDPPTLLGLAGLDPNQLRQELERSHSDALPLVGRDLSPLVLGQVDPASINDPLYFMTDDDPSRGLNQDNWTGITYNSVIQPNHIETVIARLDNGGGPKVWKYSRYFDNPQFWSTPGTPGDPNADVADVILEQKEPTPSTDGTSPIACQITVKHTPKPDEFEMYNVSDDPMELNNLYNAQSPSPEQITLAQLLAQQCAQKRLRPISGQVLGQPTCAP